MINRYNFQNKLILDLTHQCDEKVVINDNPSYSAKYWQNLDTSNGTFKIFNAYYDTRTIPFYEYSVIRIIAFINRKDPTVKTSCQIWYENLNEPVIVPVLEYRLMWRSEWGYNHHSKSFTPYLLACMNPLKDFIPSSVSIVENDCEKASNNLKVIYNPKSKVDNMKKPFAVCVKDLDFMDDQTKQIVEWIEILSLLGADKFFIYVINIHPNMMRTLEYYEKIGKVQVEKITEPEGVPTRKESVTQWLQNEMTSLNDCMYKNMYAYDFLLPLDIDEIVMPVKDEDRTWKDLLIREVASSQNQNEISPAYVVHNVFFLLDNIHENEIQPDVPQDMMFLQHIYRAANFSKRGVGPKSFVNTEKVVVMHNHFPIWCLDGLCTWTYLDKSDAQLSHYRRDCENYPKDECEGFKKNTIRDVSLWKWKDDIVANVRKTHEELESYKK